MGLFSAIVKIGVDLARLPVAVVKDVITLGGISTEQEKPYVAQILDDIRDDAEDAD